MPPYSTVEGRTNFLQIRTPFTGGSKSGALQVLPCLRTGPKCVLHILFPPFPYNPYPMVVQTCGLLPHARLPVLYTRHVYIPRSSLTAPLA